MIWDFFINLLVENERIAYDRVFFVIFMYLMVLWVVVSLWVVHNASKRYRQKYVAWAWGIGVMILNVPLLILYFIVRPEELWLQTPDGQHSHIPADIPLANLVDDQGRINMTVNISFIPSDHSFTANFQNLPAGDKVQDQQQQSVNVSSSTKSDSKRQSNAKSGGGFAAMVSKVRTTVQSMVDGLIEEESTAKKQSQSDKSKQGSGKSEKTNRESKSKKSADNKSHDQDRSQSKKKKRQHKSKTKRKKGQHKQRQSKKNGKQGKK